ncbi:hypothetical protein BD410DRAFT_618767 [Rickenella mellea]|uniref:Granulins domain-containing protein n=1 Tax=Rickenella mellea TaxID=50990 RepID=A0A4Y7PME3_9AGAM|nr:hypothetical protein BD410DRAFT_618767 [Rickenella mellea]
MLLVELGLLSLLARSAAGIEHRPAALANHATTMSTLKPVIVMQSPSDQASSSNHGFSRFFMHQFGRIVGAAKFIASAQESSPSRPADSSTCEGGYCSAGNACVAVNGVQGCCPIGQSCTTESPSCALHGYAPCSGDDYCCREPSFSPLHSARKSKTECIFSFQLRGIPVHAMQMTIQPVLLGITIFIDDNYRHPRRVQHHNPNRHRSRHLSRHLSLHQG